MSEIDDLLENIQSTETDNLYSSVAPSRLRQIYIARTSEFVTSTHIVRDAASKKFRPSIVLKIAVPGLLLLFCVLAYTGAFEGDTPSLTFFVLLITLAAIRQFYLVLLDKKRNFNILIDQEGIQIGKNLYKWRDIQETAILYLPVYKNGVNYLVLLFKDNTYEKFDLSNFRTFEGFKKTISKYIEYFRQIT